MRIQGVGRKDLLFYSQTRNTGATFTKESHVFVLFFFKFQFNNFKNKTLIFIKKHLIPKALKVKKAEVIDARKCPAP